MKHLLISIFVAIGALTASASAQEPVASERLGAETPAVVSEICGRHADTGAQLERAGGIASLMGGGGPELEPARVEARLAAIRSELAITQAQQRRWMDLTEALRSDAEAMRTAARARAHRHVQTAPAPALPDRLRQRHALLETRLHALQRIEHAVARLFASLNQAQRGRADRALGALAGC